MMEILVNIEDLELQNLSSESTALFQKIREEKAAEIGQTPLSDE
jgi:hypothetical protein